MDRAESSFSSRIKKVYPTHGGLEYVVQTEGAKYTLTGADFRRMGEDVLFAGAVLDEDILEDVEFSSMKLSCIQKALKHLEYSAMPERRLRMKLHGKFSREVIDAALLIMKENGYIDDARLAWELCDEYFINGLAGPAKIKAKLYQKGFSRETLSEVFEEYDFSEETVRENMSELLRRKFGEDIREEDKQKALEYLVRCGYSFEDGRELLKMFY